MTGETTTNFTLFYYLNTVTAGGYASHDVQKKAGLAGTYYLNTGNIGIYFTKYRNFY